MSMKRQYLRPNRDSVVTDWELEREEWLCDQCFKDYESEYRADTCCGGEPSQRALEARGQQRLEGLET